MTNEEKLEILIELRKRIEDARGKGLDNALVVLLPTLKVLDKIFYDSDELRDLALDYLVGKISLEDIKKVIG